MKNKIIITLFALFVGSFAYSQKTIVVLPGAYNTMTNTTEIYSSIFLENNIKRYINGKNYVIDVISSQIFAQTLNAKIQNNETQAYKSTASIYSIDYFVSVSLFYEQGDYYDITLGLIDAKSGDIVFSDVISNASTNYISGDDISNLVEYINKH